MLLRSLNFSYRDKLSRKKIYKQNQRLNVKRRTDRHLEYEENVRETA